MVVVRGRQRRHAAYGRTQHFNRGGGKNFALRSGRRLA